MAKTNPYHSTKASVHHDQSRCPIGSDIETADRREGNGGKTLCEVCKKLR